MFNTKPTPDPGLDAVIADCEAELKSHPSDSKEYKECLGRYKDLQALRAANQPSGLSPDTVLFAATNLLGIVLIVGHERAHIVTSKALGFIRKLG